MKFKLCIDLNNNKFNVLHILKITKVEFVKPYFSKYSILYRVLGL